MKGLEKIPSQNDLLHAYEQLQSFQVILLNELIFYSQIARFDPRLAEQLVSYLIREWKNISPLELNSKLLQSTWSSSFGVLLEFCKLIVPPTDKQTFQKWMHLALDKVQPAQSELYFIGLRKFAGKLQKQDAQFSLMPYLKWGYLGRDVLIAKSYFPSHDQKTILDNNRRLLFLNSWLKNKQKVTVNDYLAELNFSLSRRQAERDLAKHPWLIAHGHSKGRFYSVKTTSRRA